MSTTSDRLPLTRCQSLCLVLDTPKGRGVFAGADIPSGTVLETCPVLVLPPDENQKHIGKTVLFHYTYNWPLVPSSDSSNNGTASHTQAVVFGLGSLFNHSVRHQNVGWTRDVARQMITYHALRDIGDGEELCISYGNHLTFEDAEANEQSEDEGADDMLGRIEVDGHSH